MNTRDRYFLREKWVLPKVGKVFGKEVELNVEEEAAGGIFARLKNGGNKEKNRNLDKMNVKLMQSFLLNRSP